MLVTVDFEPDFEEVELWGKPRGVQLQKTIPESLLGYMQEESWHRFQDEINYALEPMQDIKGQLQYVKRVGRCLGALAVVCSQLFQILQVLCPQIVTSVSSLLFQLLPLAAFILFVVAFKMFEWRHQDVFDQRSAVKTAIQEICQRASVHDPRINFSLEKHTGEDSSSDDNEVSSTRESARQRKQKKKKSVLRIVVRVSGLPHQPL
eukprot:gnl/MRDRNA2_/MRDRNA2_276534_c0_seq1.p1 gnl/MRDRNA2_/MRDRNA2_276534_c0~~gnl/MRDRNA2_/MRDRNA2_276534_c0_seq1.p1  ORF type:complete len:206 (-),score=30.51 gnl/MRDRNA2_/MRDRNA2_276534_c0_seq1:33-650(-)